MFLTVDDFVSRMFLTVDVLEVDVLVVDVLELDVLGARQRNNQRNLDWQMPLIDLVKSEW